MTFISLMSRISKAYRIFREYGLMALLRLTRQKLQDSGAPLSKLNLVDHFEFVLQGPCGDSLTLADVPSNTVNWFIPPIGRGSGGHLNIFRFIFHLEKVGFECNVVIIGAPEALPESLTNKLISEWYFPVNAKVFWGLEHAPPAHVSLATAWKTAYAVRNFQSTVHKCYFVQDFEPWFYPVGSEFAMAEETYRFGFTGITAGDWLASKLAEEYGMKTFSVGFSYDHDRYRPLRQQDPAVQRVFFYARPTTARRAFELGVLALNIVSKRHPNVEVIFAGGDISAYEIPFKYTDAGIADLDALPELYSRCSVALVLSFSNLSLLPLELMACGVPVVSNRAACTEWLLNDQNSLLATPNAEGLAEAVCTVLSDPSVAARLRQEGLKTAVSTDWSREAGRVADVLRRLDSSITGNVTA